VRVINLLIPYLIWSALWYVLDAVQGYIYPPSEYVTRLFTGAAAGGSYYFVPLMFQFYLLAPFIVRLAKTRPRLLLTAAAGVQLVAFGFKYLQIFDVDAPGLSLFSWITEHWLIFLWAFYFPLGVVCGLHGERIRQAAERHFRAIMLALAFSLLLAIVEPELIYRALDLDVRFVPLTLPPALYSVLFVFAFVMFDRIKVPRANALYYVGGKSYGIYLVHLKAIEFVSRVIRQVAPMLLAFPVTIMLPVTFIVGLSVPLILMRIVSHSRVRWAYRYLFG